LRDRVRVVAGRDAEPTAGIIDAQSVKAAASVPAATRGFDGGKKVNGRKRHITVDTLGLLLAVMVTAASVTDRDAGQTLLARLHERHWRVTRVWADGGCTGRLVDVARAAWRISLTVVRRSDDASGFTVLPKRWLVERTFAWLMHSRRLARDYEKRTDTSEAVIRWSMSMAMSRRLARRARGTAPDVPPPASQPASPARPGAWLSTALPPPWPGPARAHRGCESTAVHRLPVRPVPTGQDVHDPLVVRRGNRRGESFPPVGHG
ncbi:transposase, partial [Streptomyces sp. NPDC021356]|uniref:transposase n=1 Tax=Streptomyces sp. NPDC021356 TaxID=3154900 RepID=UPI0033E2665A